MHCFLPPPSFNNYLCALSLPEKQTSQRWSTQGANKSSFPGASDAALLLFLPQRGQKEWQVPFHVWSRPQATAQPGGFLEARHKQVLSSTSVHINKTGQIIIKMGRDAAQSSALQPSRDFVVWNVASVCMTCILGTVNYIFLFVKEEHV